MANVVKAGDAPLGALPVRPGLHLPSITINHVELVLMVIFVIVSISAILYTEYMAMAMKRTRRQVLL